MELLIGLAAVAGLHFGAVFTSMSFFKKAFLEEKDFHVLTDGGQLRVLAGPRHTPLKIAEAESHLSAITKLARSSAWNWGPTFWRLYGPRRSRLVTSDLDKVRRHAVESQRQELLLKALRKGYDDDPIMGIIMKAETDESFQILRKKIETASQEEPLSIGVLEAKIYVEEPLSSKPGEVLLHKGKTKAISSKKSSAKSVTAVSGAGRGVPLPESYSWDLEWNSRGQSFEKVVVILRGPKGVVQKEGFYTSIYSTPHEQGKELKRIQIALAYSARHDMSSDGFAPELTAYL